MLPHERHHLSPAYRHSDSAVRCCSWPPVEFDAEPFVKKTSKPGQVIETLDLTPR